MNAKKYYSKHRDENPVSFEEIWSGTQTDIFPNKKGRFAGYTGMRWLQNGKIKTMW
jgi:hypothetical protein